MGRQESVSSGAFGADTKPNAPSAPGSLPPCCVESASLRYANLRGEFNLEKEYGVFLEGYKTISAPLGQAPGPAAYLRG